MKRVLLTGIGGSIGVHFVAHILHNTDWEIVGIDSFRHKGEFDRITEVCRDHPDWPARINIITHDLTAPLSPRQVNSIGPVNYILHLAAMSDVDYSTKQPIEVVRNNVESTINIVDYAINNPHDVFWYFSTDEVYGPTTKDSAHDEWDAHRPSNGYSASKAMGEDFCYPFWRSGQLKLILSNTMNNYGEMQSPSKYPVIVQRNLNNNETTTVHGNDHEIGTRYYIHSRNTADAVLFVLKNQPPAEHKIGEIDDPDRYHIVGDVQLDNLELGKKIAELMGKEFKYQFQDFHKDNPAHDIHYGLKDNNLKRLGWKQPKSFEDSLTETIKWQQNHKEWIK